MKTLSIHHLLLSALLLGAAFPATAQTKIATINLQKVFDGYWKTKQADVQLRDQANAVEKKRSEMFSDYEKATKDYKKLLDEANDQAVSADERERRKKAAETKLRDLQDMDNTYQKFMRAEEARLQEQKQRMRQKILGEITKVVKTDAAQAGYTLVLDSAAQSKDLTSIVIFSASGSDDLTDKVLAEVNANAPADLPKVDDDKSGTGDKPVDKKNDKKDDAK
ncbi:MAG: OmpH family outer membrane protein [Verrucomicrobia bacterium]|nr:OmpH family outer membrane protein [Verrucomicrobiota bacterium]